MFDADVHKLSKLILRHMVDTAQFLYSEHIYNRIVCHLFTPQFYFVSSADAVFTVPPAFSTLAFADAEILLTSTLTFLVRSPFPRIFTLVTPLPIKPFARHEAKSTVSPSEYFASISVRLKHTYSFLNG